MSVIGDGGVVELTTFSVQPKYRGVETVVRLVQVDGQQYIDIRDRIEVDGEQVWGRGYLFPPELAGGIAQGLRAASRAAPARLPDTAAR